MKINWKLRIRNKATLTALIGILVAAIYQIANLFGFNLPVAQEEILSTCGLIITALAAFGIVVDPTTAGAGDSEQALKYETPKER